LDTNKNTNINISYQKDDNKINLSSSINDSKDSKNLRAKYNSTNSNNLDINKPKSIGISEKIKN